MDKPPKTKPTTRRKMKTEEKNTKRKTKRDHETEISGTEQNRKDDPMDYLTGGKLIETTAKQLARKYPEITRDTWKKEAVEIYEHNERFDGEPVSLKWFMTKVENSLARRQPDPVDQDSQVRSENEGDFEEYKALKRKGYL